MVRSGRSGIVKFINLENEIQLFYYYYYSFMQRLHVVKSNYEIAIVIIVYVFFQEQMILFKIL